MDNIKKMFDYYSANYKKLLFFSKLSIEKKEYAIMYPHDEADEVERFVDNFTKYFPFYVWNEDQLEVLQLEKNVEDALEKASYDCWNDSVIVPQRQTKMNGIYGEVYLDFYERVVKNNKLVCTYAGKRSFRSNDETKGFDNVLYVINDSKIELVFSEAKFVVDCSAATLALKEDIIGKQKTIKNKAKLGHFTKEFLNDYISFIVQKNSYFSDEERVALRSFFKKLNDILVNGDKDFVQYLIDDKIKMNCVFFAIFKSNKFTPKDLITYYNQIYKQAESNLHAIGISNYSIEIVFVPTFSDSMKIKGDINEHYNKR